VLTGVFGPSEGCAVVVWVTDPWVGAEFDQRLDQIELAVERGVVEGRASIGGVEVVADVDQEA
jgi:hypothetical protein